MGDVTYEIVRLRNTALSCNDTVTKINIPASITNLSGDDFKSDRNLEGINVSEENQDYCSIEGVVYNKNKTTLIKVPSKNKNGALIIPETTVNCGMKAIDNNTKITYIRMPKAFVAALYCFDINEFNALEHIDVEDGNEAYKSVNGVLLSNDGTKLLYYPPCKHDESYEMPSFVEEIDSCSFYYPENLKNLSFGKRPVYISNSAFCGVKLTSINHVTTREGYLALDNDIRKNIQDNLDKFEGQPIITSLVEQEVDYAISTYIGENTHLANYQKIRALYDYTAAKVTYDYDNKQAGYNHCVSSLFLRDKTVCEGYALAMKLLLDKAGIRNELVVTGRAIPGPGHAWNIVNLNNTWLHIDPTWDDADLDNATTKYFFKTTEEYEKLGHRVDYFVSTRDLHNYSWTTSDPALTGTTPNCDPLFGDIDDDGELTYNDVRAMRDELRGFEYYAYAGYYNLRADMNRDGVLDSKDYDLLEQLVVKQQ